MSVVMGATVSLDGFVAQHDDGVAELFDWYRAGQVAVAPGDPDRSFAVSATSAEWVAESYRRIGVVVIGRRTFDYTHGWEGRPAAGHHVVVVTHSVPTDWPHLRTAPFTFVTEGVTAAVAWARELAGDADVSLTAGDVGGQAFAAGLVDEVELALAPVVFGTGRRFFGGFAGPHVRLEDPHVVVEGRRVTHLRYRVPRR